MYVIESSVPKKVVWVFRITIVHHKNHCLVITSLQDINVCLIGLSIRRYIQGEGILWTDYWIDMQDIFTKFANGNYTLELSIIILT